MTGPNPEAEASGELRERIYREIVLTEAVSASGASHITDALLSGPLAPLLDAQAAVRRVEALIDPETGMATGNGYDAGRLFDEKDIRAALAGLRDDRAPLAGKHTTDDTREKD